MTKVEFTQALARRLSNLPPQEIDRITAFYAEMVDDRVEDGMSEEEAVAALGDIDTVARQAMMDLPLPVLMRSKVNESRKKADSKMLWVILAIVGFPVWFPLLMTLGALIFSLYFTVWVLIASLAIAVLSIGIGGIAGLVGSVPVMASVSPAPGLFMLGCSLMLIGLTLFLIKPVLLICKALARFTVYAINQIKRLFITGKEN